MIFNGRTMTVNANFTETDEMAAFGLTSENGVLLTTAPAAGRVGGINALGYEWYQVEDAEPLDAPYLQEWGYKLCVEESNEANYMQPLQIYEWIYRCLLEGLATQKRTICINGNMVEFDTCGEATAQPFVLSLIEGDETASVLNVPLAQFPALTAEEIKRYFFRVQFDNPQLCFPMCPSTEEITPIEYYSGDAYGMGRTDGDALYLFSTMPKPEKMLQMRQVCSEQAAAIKEKVFEIYGISTGDALEPDQKKKVLKVIHDYIVEHAKMTGKNEYYTGVMYAVFDKNCVGVCSGYTDAFVYVARMYGIEALHMSGYAYGKQNADGTYGAEGSHAWVAVNLIDDYGVYSDDEYDWAGIDVYWDEAEHFGESDEAGTTWKYFMNADTVSAPQGSETYREIITSKGYGAYPFTLENGSTPAPVASYPYSGNSLYIWEDEEGEEA